MRNRPPGPHGDDEQHAWQKVVRALLAYRVPHAMTWGTRWGMRSRKAGVKEAAIYEVLWHAHSEMTAHYSVAQVRESRERSS